MLASQFVKLQTSEKKALSAVKKSQIVFQLVNGNCEPDSLHRTTKHMFKVYTEAALAQESGEIAPGLFRPE